MIMGFVLVCVRGVFVVVFVVLELRGLVLARQVLYYLSHTSSPLCYDYFCD
jgi:hypothetical protein